MAKKNPAPTKPKTPAASERRVWRIYRYRERFELAEDVRSCRQSALNFTRDYVGVGAGNEAVGYQQQLAMLSNGQGEEYFLLYGIYRALINESSKRSKAYRGYLLDAAHEPLSDAQIGKMLKIHAKMMTRLLRRLAAVSLLERVDLPKKWDLSQEELPSKKEKQAKDAGASPDKKRRNSADNEAFSGSARSAAEDSAELRKSAQAFKKESISKKYKEPNGKRKATLGLTASGCKKKNNGIGEAQDSSTRKSKSHKQSSKAPTGSTASAPAPPPPRPIEPQGFDEGGRASTSARSPESVYPQGVKSISAAGLTYGHRVYTALGYHWTIESPEAQREICSFGSQHDRFCKILANLPPPDRDVILQRGLVEARKMARRKANRRQGAVWNDTMNKIVAKHAMM